MQKSTYFLIFFGYICTGIVAFVMPLWFYGTFCRVRKVYAQLKHKRHI